MANTANVMSIAPNQQTKSTRTTSQGTQSRYRQAMRGGKRNFSSTLDQVNAKLDELKQDVQDLQDTAKKLPQIESDAPKTDAAEETSAQGTSEKPQDAPQQDNKNLSADEKVDTTADKPKETNSLPEEEIETADIFFVAKENPDAPIKIDDTQTVETEIPIDAVQISDKVTETKIPVEAVQISDKVTIPAAENFVGQKNIDEPTTQTDKKTSDIIKPLTDTEDTLGSSDDLVEEQPTINFWTMNSMAYLFGMNSETLLATKTVDTPTSTDVPKIDGVQEVSSAQNLMTLMPQTNSNAHSMLNMLGGRSWRVIETPPEFQAQSAEIQPQVQAQPVIQTESAEIQPQIQAQPVIQTEQAEIQPQVQSQPIIQTESAEIQPQVQSQPIIQTESAEIQPQVQAQPVIQTESAQIQPQVQAQPVIQTEQAAIQPQVQAQPVIQTESAEIQPRVQSQPVIQTESAEVQPQVQAQPIIQTESAEIQPQVQAQPVIQTESAEIQPQVQAQPIIQTEQPQIQPQVQAQPVIQTESAEIQPQVQTQPVIQTESAEIQPQVQTQPVIQTESAEVQPQVQSQPIIQTESAEIQPQVQVQAQSAPQVQVQPTAQVEIQSSQPVAQQKIDAQPVQQNLSDLLGVNVQVEDATTSTPVTPPQSTPQQFDQDTPQRDAQNFQGQTFQATNDVPQQQQTSTGGEIFAVPLAASNDTAQPQQVTATQAPDAPPPTQEDFDVPAQIVRQARLIRTTENTEMVIKLNPEHLGELTLRISVSQNGAVSASFHSDNAQVRTIIENSLVQLKQELNDQGLKVENVQVYAGLSEDSLMNGQGGQAWQQNRQQRQGNRQINLDALENDIDATTPVNESSATDGVDYSV